MIQRLQVKSNASSASLIHFIAMKISSTLGIITFALALTACSSATQQSQQSSSSSASLEVTSSSSAAVDLKDLYRYYESKELGVSFYYPAVYDALETHTGGLLQFGEKQIPYSEVVAWIHTGAEGPSIRAMKTTDAQILQYFSHDNPLGKIKYKGMTLTTFKQDGMGDTSGFIEKINNKYFVLSFDFASSEEMKMRVLESLQIY